MFAKAIEQYGRTFIVYPARTSARHSNVLLRRSAYHYQAFLEEWFRQSQMKWDLAFALVPLNCAAIFFILRSPPYIRQAIRK
jgi:hypothetical protein